MFGFAPRPVPPDSYWLLHHVDLVIEWQFLLLLALFVLMWRHRRPRESQLLLLASVFQGLSSLMPQALNWLAGVLWLPLGGQNALFAVRAFLHGLCSVRATSAQAVVWWFLVQAACGDQSSPPQLPDKPQASFSCASTAGFHCPSIRWCMC